MCPAEWLRQTEWVPVQTLRGAGKLSLLPSTPAKSSGTRAGLSLSGSTTPKRGSSRNSLSVLASTPGRGSRASGGQGSLLKANSSRSAPARSVKSQKSSRAPDAPRSGKRHRGTDFEQASSVCTPATAARSGVVSQVSKHVKRSHHAPTTAPSTKAPSREAAKVLTVKPEPLGLPKLPLFLAKAPKDPEKPKPTLWWTCDFPGCGFQVFKKPDVQGHSHYRKVHLQQVHGVTHPPSLRGARELETR